MLRLRCLYCCFRFVCFLVVYNKAMSVRNWIVAFNSLVELGSNELREVLCNVCLS